MLKIGVIGIIVHRGTEAVQAIQALLSEFSDIIIGRMGVPDHESDISAISVIVKGTMERISALSGKLGKIKGANIKSAIQNITEE
jgi:putative iron-only hydrogenase system regulator